LAGDSEIETCGDSLPKLRGGKNRGGRGTDPGVVSWRVQGERFGGGGCEREEEEEEEEEEEGGEGGSPTE
jgi:hypothetical protein